MLDGFPVKTCRYARGGIAKSFKVKAWFCYCASQKEKYFGFKGHLLITEQGFIVNYSMTPANSCEREASFEILEGYSGQCLRYKGYLREDYWDLLDQMEVFMKTPLSSNMKDNPLRETTKDERDKRRLIEMVIGQLGDRFNLSKMRARTKLYFTGKVARKILSHTIFALRAFQLGYSPTQLNQVIPIL